jgi:mitochondrial import inner membrane translocase subunit TIM50
LRTVASHVPFVSIMLSRTFPALIRASALRSPQPILHTALFSAPSRTYAKVGKPQQPQWQPESAQPPRRPVYSSKPPSNDDDVTASASLNETQQPGDPTSGSEPDQPLPDLTKGIPSTLAYELNEAQRAHSKADKGSLNITEDPAEPLPSEEDGGPRRPRVEYVSSSDRKKNTAFRYTYLFLGLGVVGYSLYLGRNWETEELREKHAEDAPDGWSPGMIFTRIRARMESTRSYYNDPVTTKLLPDEEKNPEMRMPFTLVLSLEDMLVHQEWDRAHGWRIAKRPGVDYFLRYLTQYYEIVLFTSQPSAIADQVLRKLDPYMMIRWPLFREATLYKDGQYIKVC